MHHAGAVLGRLGGLSGDALRCEPQELMSEIVGKRQGDLQVMVRVTMMSSSTQGKEQRRSQDMWVGTYTVPTSVYDLCLASQLLAKSRLLTCTTVYYYDLLDGQSSVSHSLSVFLFS
eukprot:5975080-Amphidinium_carterae.1